MLFSSMTFLWIFLPTVFLGHIILPVRLKNAWLLIASLFFYSWGEPVYVFLMMFSVAANYLLALLIDQITEEKKKIVLVG